MFVRGAYTRTHEYVRPREVQSMLRVCVRVRTRVCMCGLYEGPITHAAGPQARLVSAPQKPN